MVKAFPIVLLPLDFASNGCQVHVSFNFGLGVVINSYNVWVQFFSCGGGLGDLKKKTNLSFFK